MKNSFILFFGRPFSFCLIATLSLVFLNACMVEEENDTKTFSKKLAQNIYDGSHGGTEGFYFLPSMVKSPSYSGSFDAALSPIVEICETEDCFNLLASYSMTEGVGSEIVRVDNENEHYIVNWHTQNTNTPAGGIYHLRIRVNDVILGYARVAITTNGSLAREFINNGQIALVYNQTLPVKFRIETGIPGAIVVTPAEATISVGETQQFTAEVYDLHGELLNGSAITWSSDNSEVATIDESGLATGQDEGSSSITASSGPSSGNAYLIVEDSSGPVVECPFSSSGGDLISRSFYVTEFPGTRMNAVLLKMYAINSGVYGFNLTARKNTYNGELLGIATAQVTFNGNSSQLTEVMFDFDEEVLVSQGSIVTFVITKVSGPTSTFYYNTGFCAGTSSCNLPATCPVIQTNGSSPPLDTFRRNGVGIIIY
jgi:plastocyanin